MAYWPFPTFKAKAVARQKHKMFVNEIISRISIVQLVYGRLVINNKSRETTIPITIRLIAGSIDMVTADMSYNSMRARSSNPVQ